MFSNIISLHARRNMPFVKKKGSIPGKHRVVGTVAIMHLFILLHCDKDFSNNGAIS
jgi:hypothetical protein